MDDQTAKMLKGTINPNLEVEPENVIMLTLDSVHAVSSADMRDTENAAKEGD